MSAQDKAEKIMRELHVALSKGENVPKKPDKVIVDRQKMIDLLTELNACMYEIMDEHEMTLRSRDKAEREFRRKSDEIIEDATNKAEDIYAAAFMYTDEALIHVQEIMKENTETIERMFSDMKEKMLEETRRVKTNQLELKSQLQDFKDTEKYLNLIHERNRAIEKQKKEGVEEPREEGTFYAGRKTEIKINTDYFEKMGITPEEEVSVEEVPQKKAEVIIKVQEPLKTERDAKAQEKQLEIQKKEAEHTKEDNFRKKDSEIEDLEIMEDLDAEYFRWKEEEEAKSKKSAGTGKQTSNREHTKDLSEGIHKVWKSLTQRNS